MSPGSLGHTRRAPSASLLACRLEACRGHDPAILHAIQERAAHRGFRVTDRVARQADVPEGATVLPNDHGSAPGLHGAC
jgi:nicotinamide-nucleotide amidase